MTNSWGAISKGNGLGKLIFTLVLYFLSVLNLEASVKLIPDSLLKWPDKEANYVILVDKAAQRLLVYSRGNISKPVKIYACSTGENSGPKSRRNDRKTPEGIYFFTNSYKERDLAPIYGARAFPIDYPNPLDQTKGRSGYGIWLHGTNKPLKPRDTNGCVVLENEDIKELAGYVELGRTPVIINDRIKRVSPDLLEKESQELEAFIEHWKNAWEGKDIPNYTDLYHHDFVSKGMDRKQWRKYKDRLAKKYGKISVDIDNLQLFKSNGVVFAKFHQTYLADQYESRGEKRLYLKKNSNKWKIVGEFFEEENNGPKLKRKRSQKEVSEIKFFVDSWKNAWENKDIASYGACYDHEFRSRGMDFAAWKRYKKALNKKYEKLDIKIQHLKIIPLSGPNAEVRFTQIFKADNFIDKGTKRLFLVKRGNHWKILKETWRLVAKKPDRRKK